MLHSRTLLRFGSFVKLNTISALPVPYMIHGAFPEGKCIGAYILPRSHTVWVRLSERLGGQIWPPSMAHTEHCVIPLTAEQDSAPLSHSIELFGSMPLYCSDGKIGRLRSILIDNETGAAVSLVAQVRARTLFASSDSQSAALWELSGKSLLIPPQWVLFPPEPTEYTNGEKQLYIDATSQQIAHCLLLRDDAEVCEDIWSLVAQSTALAPYIAGLHITVREGTVELSGEYLPLHLKNMLENDIWHIGGVLNIVNHISSRR